MEEYEKNPDGTDKLDEEGNPILVKKVTDEELEVARVKKLEEDNSSIVGELKEIRLKLGVAEGLLKSKEKEPEIEPKKDLTEDDKITLVVKKVLDEKDASDAQANKKAAFEKFVTDNKEFNPDNDPTGLKRDALQKKFDSFNTNEFVRIEEFLSVIEDSKTLLLGNDKLIDTSKDSENPYPNSNPKNKIKGKEEEELSPKELKLAETTGKTKEQILKLKIKDPDYLESLLEYVRD